MELTNKQRKYLGLEPINPAWERMEIPNNSVKPELSTGKHILYFDGDILRKNITVNDSGSYLEQTCHIKTQDNRTMIAPKTAKGKPKRLNGVNLQRCTPEGAYFRFAGSVLLANYTTQHTYYSSVMAGLPFMSESELQAFLDKWIAETDDEELRRIEAFAHAKRRRCKFKEGDFFRFSIDRTNYGYGRILLDVAQMRKNGEKFWDIVMCKPLVVSVYHIITPNPSMDIEILKTLKSCPSQFIMDNRFFYGEYEIVGNAPITEKDVDYPIMYGQGISPDSRKVIRFQMGRIFKEIPLEGNELVKRASGRRDKDMLPDFLNNGIGWSLGVDKNILEACIEQGSNEPYWNQSIDNNLLHRHDLRSPLNRAELERVLRQMGLDDIK